MDKTGWLTIVGKLRKVAGMNNDNPTDPSASWPRTLCTLLRCSVSIRLIPTSRLPPAGLMNGIPLLAAVSVLEPHLPEVAIAGIRGQQAKVPLPPYPLRGLLLVRSNLLDRLEVEQIEDIIGQGVKGEPDADYWKSIAKVIKDNGANVIQ